MASVAKGSFPPRAVAISVVLALLAASITVGQVKVAELLAAAVLGYVLARAFKELLSHWSWLVYGLAAVNLLIPEDDRYTLHGTGGAGFELEPYRVILTVMILAWIAALMIDPEVRFRKTKFDGPLALIFVAIAGSEIFNAARASSLSSFVTKALFLGLCLLALLYILASVIRSRETIERILKVLVCCGCVVAVGGAIQNATTFNIFDHIHGLLPIFTFNAAAGGGAILRGGHFRALASAGHPIELANEMAMLTPIAAYLAIRGRKLWALAIPVLLLGNLSSGSRTGIIGLVVVIIVFIWMRPRQTLRCWPALIPMLVVVELLMPGELSGVVNQFFPKGGLIAQQSQTFVAHGQVQQASRLSRLGPQLHGVFAKHNEFFGEGYGTRVIGRTSLDAHLNDLNQAAADNAQILDDQWLGNLLDTGLVGLVAWLWLFVAVVRKLKKRAVAERDTTEGWLPVALAASITCYGFSMLFYDAASFLQATVVLDILLGCASALLWLEPAAKAGGAGRLIAPRFDPGIAAASGYRQLVVPGATLRRARPGVSHARRGKARLAEEQH